MATPQRPGTTPKYLHIYETIRDRIHSHVWKRGEQLPPARVIADEFGVTPVTVWKALDALGQEKLVYRVQGKGTFVSQTACEPQQSLIGVVMQTEGHCYGTMFCGLIHAIAERNGHTVAGSIGPDQDYPRAERVRSLEQFLTRDLDALIVDGRVVTPFEVLAEHWPNGRGLTFIHRYEGRQHFPEANFILTAWDVGAEAAARHLLAKGMERLLFLTFGDSHAAVPGISGSIHYNWQMKEGMERAIAAHGGDPRRDLKIVVDAPGEESEDCLRQALADGFRGVLCGSDHRALRVYRQSALMGLEVGRDVLVSGFFDTPWASNFHPTLTSVSVQEARLVELAAECVTEGWHGRHMTVPPVLIPRESTGATLDADILARNRGTQ